MPCQWMVFGPICGCDIIMCHKSIQCYGNYELILICICLVYGPQTMIYGCSKWAQLWTDEWGCDALSIFFPYLWFLFLFIHWFLIGDEESFALRHCCCCWYNQKKWRRWGNSNNIRPLLQVVGNKRVCKGTSYLQPNELNPVLLVSVGTCLLSSPACRALLLTLLFRRRW